MAMTQEQLLLLQEELRKKKEAEMAGAPESIAPEDNVLDSIVARKQRPDPLAGYDERIQAATGATPNMGQMIGAGFAGLGQSLTLGRQNYLDKTLAGIESGRKRGIESAELAKTQFEDQDERDPMSPTSKEYQMLAAKFTKRKPEEVANLSAYDLKKTMPILEKMYKIETESSDRDLKRKDYMSEQQKQRDLLVTLAGKKADATAEAKKDKPTTAQMSVDREFAREYSKYVAGGGYADAMNQISTLEGVLGQLEQGKQLTGPIMSTLPDAVRKRVIPSSMEAQQAVEQSVQRTLKQTLGGQFTEREGVLFMQRGYDPALGEEENAKKLRRTINQLKTMAMAKQQAADYYEDNGTLQGFKGTLYTIKDGEMVRTSKDDFYKMMGSGQLNGEGENEEMQTGPHGNRVKQNGKVYVWDGTKYVEEK